MLKVDMGNNDSDYIEARGDIPEMLSDLAYLTLKIYRWFAEEGNGYFFKRSFQRMVADDNSIIWKPIDSAKNRAN